MGGRFLISGTQIGCLKALIECNKNKQATNMVDEIFENQYLGESDKPIQIDINHTSKIIRKVK